MQLAWRGQKDNSVLLLSKHTPQEDGERVEEQRANLSYGVWTKKKQKPTTSSLHCFISRNTTQCVCMCVCVRKMHEHLHIMRRICGCISVFNTWKMDVCIVCVPVCKGLSLNIVKLRKTPKSLARSLTHFFPFTPSHQKHLSERNRGSLRVVSLFGATNKSSRALHQMNSPLDWRLHKGLLTRCVRACFGGIEYIHTYRGKINDQSL